MKKVILRIYQNLKEGPGTFRFMLLFLLVVASSALQAQGVVSGQVTDETGSPLPGVNILLKNTTSGTTTDAEGRYSISVAEDGVLIFSFIGYTTQEEAVGGRSVINVALNPSLETLSEIVVVGYGAQKKSDVTGSVVSVDSKALREIPAAGLSQALQGRAAGVDITQTSSKPGGEMQIRIRGNRSLGNPQAGNNNPLIVLDGIPYGGNLNDINQNDIVSVDILKDASATAIYGSRGSNGVIIITTRRGKTGKAQLSYNGYAGVTMPLGKYDVFNGEEYRRFMVDAGTNPFTADEQESILMGREVNWQDVIYKNGFQTNHEIGVTGGTEETQFALSGGYFNQTTVLPGQGFERYSLRTVLDQKIGDRIKIGINSMNTVTIREGENANPMFQALTLSPLYKPYTDQGEINEEPAVGSLDYQTINPLNLYRDNLWREERRRLRSFNSLYGEVEIIDGLKYRLNVGLDYRMDKFGSFYGTRTPMRGVGAANTARVDAGEAWSYTLENLVLYDKTFAENHKLNFTGLFSVQEEESASNRFNTSNVSADYVQYFNFGLAGDVVPQNHNYSRWGLLSYMGRVNYNFADRYLLTLTARADGSSRLAEGNKWFYYPAAALGWNIMNESFLSNVDFISNLKLRAGWGRTSNQAINPYQSLGNLQAVGYSFGSDGGENGYYVSNLPNSTLTWEFTTTTNVGLDIGLFTNRLTASVDAYFQQTTDILQERQLPIMSGVTNPIQQNVGATEGKGIELTLNSINIESQTDGGFNWSSDLNLSFHREEITQLFDTLRSVEGSGWFVGQPVDVIFDYKKIGIWQLDEADEAAAFGPYVPGDVRVADLNGNGVVDADDRTIIGTLLPKWQGGFTNRFSFKNFDLSVVTFFRYGGMLVSSMYIANQNEPYANLEGRRNSVDVDYWTPTNPTNAYPRPGTQQPQHGSTLGYFDATYFKIRSINLGYTLPASITSRIKMSSVRVYVIANNPFKAFFSEYVDAGGLDPEPTSRGGVPTPGYGQRLVVRPDTPITRAFLFGVNASF